MKKLEQINLVNVTTTQRDALTAADGDVIYNSTLAAHQVRQNGAWVTFAPLASPTFTGHVTQEGVTATGATGTGKVVFDGTPTLVTPVLGAATATSINSTTIPTSKTLVVTTDKLSVLAATSSSELAGVISDETGSGGLVFGTSPAITTPTGIVKGDVGLGNVDNTSNATERAATATLTNKAITQRETTITSNATWAPNADTTDIFTVTAQAVAATTISNPSGTPTQGQWLTIRVTDDGTTRALTWSGTQWRAANNLTLPGRTVVGQVVYALFRYNSTDTKWDLINSSLTTVTFRDSTDPTKVGILSAASISTGTTRVLNLPDRTDTIVTLNGTETLAAKTLTSPVLNTGVSGTAIDTDSTFAANSDTILPSQKAIKSALAGGGGWFPDTNTWTRTGNLTFTLAVDATGWLKPGTKISYNDGAVDYGVVATATFSAGTTTVTLIGNDDYAMAAGTITAPRYSYSANPTLFPPAFNYTPTLSGFSANPTNMVHRWSTQGRMMTLFVRHGTAGTSNNASHTATLPSTVTAATITNMIWFNFAIAVDNGTTQTGYLQVSSAGTTVVLVGILATSTNTGSGSSRIIGGQIAFEF